MICIFLQHLMLDDPQAVADFIVARMNGEAA
jgi:hypothetical protein